MSVILSIIIAVPVFAKQNINVIINGEKQYIKEYNINFNKNDIIPFSVSTSHIVIGKRLILSPTFPPLHTVRATFTAYGVPTISCHSILHHFQRFYGVYLTFS